MRKRQDGPQASHRAFRIEGVERDLDEELVAAAGIPAWRAARVDPNVVLREE